MTNPTFEIGEVYTGGYGGIIGSDIAAADIGDITVSRGFGIINSFISNAGEGTIMNAQRACVARSLDRRAWRSVETVAPEVPRWRYRETLGYVRKIRAGLETMDEKGRMKKTGAVKR